MAEKQTNKQRLKEITDSIEANIQELFQSEKYADYLRTMSRFHKYSFNNIMLIHMQKPDATLVAGYNKWEQKWSRHVKRGEKGIKIIAPTPFKKKIEQEKLDPDTRLPMRDRDGNIIMEEKDVTIPMFKPVVVFDVSQTEGEPLPTLATDLKGDVKHYETFMEALRRSSPVPVEIETISDNMDGYFSPDKQCIAIRDGMSQVQTVSALIHEITHSKLHNYEKAQQGAAKDRNTEEVEAESVSYAVCQYYGIQTGENSFGYIASWSKGKELPELRASLEIINRTADGLISDIDRNFTEICRERGVELDGEQVGAPILPGESATGGETLEKEPDEQFFKVNEGQYLHIQRSDSGYDYTLYDAASRQAMDGGQLDAPDLSISAAAREVCKLHEVQADEISAVADTLPEDFSKEPSAPRDYHGELVEHVLKEDETLWDTTLDEYPVPDISVEPSELAQYGIEDRSLLLLSKNVAVDMMDNDLTVYAVTHEGTVMVLSREEVESYQDGTLFAISREEWEGSNVFHMMVWERTLYQDEREYDFMDYPGDAYAIYQMKPSENLRYLRHQPYEQLERLGEQPYRDNYELIYTHAGLPEDPTQDAILEHLRQEFNIDPPVDYISPGISVSDVIALKQDGEVSYHYCDSVGFKELPTFEDSENYLESAEMQMEDDYNMVDGVINNGPKQSASQVDQAEADHRDKEARQKAAPPEKDSILAKLRRPLPPREEKKKAPEKSAEKGYSR